MFVAPLPELLDPHPHDLGSEPPDGVGVGRYRVIVKVPADDPPEPLALFFDGGVPASYELLLDCLERRPHPLRIRVPGEKKPPCP